MLIPASDLGGMMIGEFWGKARPDSPIGAHPLVAHSLDVAAVAILLAGRRHLGIDRPMLGFLCRCTTSASTLAHFRPRRGNAGQSRRLVRIRQLVRLPAQPMTWWDCTSWPMFMQTA